MSDLLFLLLWPSLVCLAYGASIWRMTHPRIYRFVEPAPAVEPDVNCVVCMSPQMRYLGDPTAAGVMQRVIARYSTQAIHWSSTSAYSTLGFDSVDSDGEYVELSTEPHRLSRRPRHY